MEFHSKSVKPVKAPPPELNGKALYKDWKEHQDYAAARSSTDSKELDGLSLSESALVRLWVSKNDAASEETLQRLTSDPDPSVSMNAKYKLQARGIDAEKRD